MNDFSRMKELLHLVGNLEKQALYESSLVEGIKFGKKEMSDIIARSTDFNVGIEYEFRPTDSQKSNLNDWLKEYGISQYIHNIVPEHDGMTEVITTKMSVSQAISLLDNMTQLIIDKDIEVPSMAGQHISISTNKYSQGTINMVKFLTLMSTQYLHRLFPEREYVGNLYHKTLKQLNVKKYDIKTKDGLVQFENDFNNIVGNKYQTIKVSDYTSIDMAGRIELRFFGGKDYHKQLELTKREMLRGLFLLEIAHTDLYHSEYLKAIYKDFYSDESSVMKQVMISPEGIKGIKNPSVELQLLAVKNNPSSIEHIDSPSEEVQLMAVKENGYAIRHIINKGITPSEEVQLAAVQEDGYAIEHIDSPSEEVQLISVKNNPRSIQHIINKGITPSEEVQLIAVNQDSDVIRLIDNPSEEVQLIAVNQDSDVIKYIDNPTEKVQLMAVRQDGRIIQHIDNPTEKVQLMVVKKDGYVIRLIDNPSEEVQLAAVNQVPYAIQHIDNPTEKVQLIVINKAGMKIEYINNPSEETQLIAVRKNEYAIEDIDNPTEKAQALHDKLWG